MTPKKIETNIVFTLARMLKRQWPEGAETVDGWLEGLRKIQDDSPRIGDLVIVFDKPDEWWIGTLADCKDAQIIPGREPYLKWRLKGCIDYHKYCRRLKFSDLNGIVGFGLEEVHEKGEEKKDERN